MEDFSPCGNPVSQQACRFVGGGRDKRFFHPSFGKVPPPPPHLCQKTLVAFNRARGGAGWTHRDRDRDRAAAAGGGARSRSRGLRGGGCPGAQPFLGQSARLRALPAPSSPCAEIAPPPPAAAFRGAGGRAGGGASPGRSGAGPVPSRSRPGWPRGGRNSSRSRRFWVLGGFGDRRQSGRGCPPTGRQPGVAAPLRSPPDRLR